MDNHLIIRQNISDSIDLKTKILNEKSIQSQINRLCISLINCFKNEGKVLFCGNGGSAADSQHLAAELSGRYYFDRPPLNCEALHENSAYLTAVANDYSYNQVYSRLLEAIGRKGDIIIGLSTSGNSENIVEAMKTARAKGMITVGLTGKGGGSMIDLCDILIEVPSTDTPRIQECHMMIGHTFCQIVEQSLFS